MAERRAESSMSFDMLALTREKAWIRRAEADGHFGEIGSWHTHVNSRDGRPSEQDLFAWLDARDFLDRSYLGLILTAAPSDPTWNSPTIHAWIIRRTDALTPICEPAAVDVGRAG